MTASFKIKINNIGDCFLINQQIFTKQNKAIYKLTALQGSRTKHIIDSKLKVQEKTLRQLQNSEINQKE